MIKDSDLLSKTNKEKSVLIGKFLFITISFWSALFRDIL